MTDAGRAPRSEEELEEALSRPGDALTATLARIHGDLLVLGAGGKMGPSLARMAKRADPTRRVIAVSRWTSHAAPTPIGRLSQKMPRHVQYSAKKPPSAGARTDETPQTDAMYPWMRPRSAGS